MNSITCDKQNVKLIEYDERDYLLTQEQSEIRGLIKFMLGSIEPNQFPDYHDIFEVINNVFDRVSPEIVTREGKILKRLDKYFKSSLNPEYYDKVKYILDSQVNPLVSKYVSKIKCYEDSTCDITDNLNWRAGDFGDFGSCFFDTDSRNHIREGMNNDSRHFAFREYNKNGKGIGRAWIYNHANRGYLLYNTYGSLNIDVYATALKFQSLLHKLTGFTYLFSEYDKCQLNKSHSDQWFNGSKIYYFWIGDETLPSSITVEIETVVECEVFGYCYECSCDLDEDNHYRYNGNLYCEDCYYETFANCEYCGEDYYIEDMIYFKDTLYCENCINEIATQCDSCGEYCANKFTHEINGSSYCEDCADNYLNECDSCGDRVPELLHKINDGIDIIFVCNTCHDNYILCDSCDYHTPKKHSFSVDDKNYCPFCFNKKVLPSLNNQSVYIL
jgi:hypothetical protein